MSLALQASAVPTEQNNNLSRRDITENDNALKFPSYILKKLKSNSDFKSFNQEVLYRLLFNVFVNYSKDSAEEIFSCYGLNYDKFIEFLIKNRY